MSKQPIRARLLDTLLSDIILPPLPSGANVISEDEAFAHNASLRRLLNGATCIEASNVARFFDESYLGETSSFESFSADLKCLVPPHARFFIEWERPNIPSAKRMGTLFLACPPELAADTARLILGENAKSTPKKIAEFRQDLRCRWIYLTLDFLDFPLPAGSEHISGLRGPFHIGTLSVAEDGSLLNFWLSRATANLPEDEAMHVAAASLVAWTTLSMMNCANIETVEHKAPDAFQKARTKSGKRPFVSYRTVRVDLGKTPRQISADALPGDGSTPRRHKKRGHMKDYRKGGGLFGRYKGVWYWGPVLAGSADEGVVISDYEVSP